MTKKFLQYKNRFVLFLIPFIGIIFKNIILQGYIQNSNSYNLNIAKGFTTIIFTLPYHIAFTFIILSISFLFKNKGQIIYLFIVDLLLSILTLTDVMYFRGFLTVPSVLILTQTANLNNLGNTLTSMLSFTDILIFIDLFIFIGYVFFIKNKIKENNKRNLLAFVLSFTIPLIYIIYTPICTNVFNMTNLKNSYLYDNYDPTDTSKYFSSLGYHIIDAITVYKDSKPYKLTDQDKKDINKFYNWKNENLPNNQYFGLSKNKNLLIIQVESMEDFQIGKSINGQEITPTLNKLLNNSLYFPNIYEQVNEGTSSDCDLMLNTSMLPLNRGCTFFKYPNANYNSLPKILSDSGYDTISIHPDKGSFWNYANALRGGIGFEKFNDYFSFDASSEQIGMGISDNSYFTQVVPMIKELDSPFFAHTITLTNHGPFSLPDKYKDLTLEKELDSSELGGYFQCIHYTDKQIGLFLEKLDKEGLLDNTTVIITGDHTGVHKYYQHSIDSLSKKEKWYSNNGNPTVPLIIYDKSFTKGQKFDTIGGQIDIMPTLLYLLGIDADKYQDTAIGRNLLNTNRNYVILTDGTIKGTNLSEKDKKIIKSSLELSTKMIKSNTF